MKYIILAVWVFFIAAFILAKIFYPEVGFIKRTKGQIKPKREYNRQGYDQRGFTPLGYHRNGTRYDDEGYDRNGLDKQGNPRPEEDDTIYVNGEPLDGRPRISVSEEKRKKLLLIAMSLLAAFITLVFSGYYLVYETCLVRGHNPVCVSCVKPLKCSRCEKEVADAPGHKWVKDISGDEVCVVCRTEKD